MRHLNHRQLLATDLMAVQGHGGGQGFAAKIALVHKLVLEVLGLQVPLGVRLVPNALVTKIADVAPVMPG